MLSAADKSSSTMTVQIQQKVRSIGNKNYSQTFPLVLNKCQIVDHPVFGRATVTTCPIEAGDTLIVEPAQLVIPVPTKYLQNKFMSSWVTPYFLERMKVHYRQEQTKLPSHLENDSAAKYMAKGFDDSFDYVSMEKSMSQRLHIFYSTCEALSKESKAKQRHILNEVTRDIICLNGKEFELVAASRNYRINAAFMRTLKDMPEEWLQTKPAIAKFSDDELWKIVNFAAVYLHCYKDEDRSSKYEVFLMSGDLTATIPHDCRNVNAIVTFDTCKMTKRYVGNVLALESLEKGAILKVTYRCGFYETMPLFMRQVTLFHGKGFWCKCDTCMTEKTDWMRSMPCPVCTPFEMKGIMTFNALIYALPDTMKSNVKELVEKTCAGMPSAWRPLNLQLLSPPLRYRPYTYLSFFVNPSLSKIGGYVYPIYSYPSNELPIWHCDKCGLKTVDPWCHSNKSVNAVKNVGFEGNIANLLDAQLTTKIPGSCYQKDPSTLGDELYYYSLVLGERHSFVWNLHLMILETIHNTQLKSFAIELQKPFHHRTIPEGIDPIYMKDDYLEECIWEGLRRTDVIFYRLLSVWPLQKGLDHVLATVILNAALNFTEAIMKLMTLNERKEQKNLIVGGIACAYLCTLSRIYKVCYKAITVYAWLDFIQGKSPLPFPAISKFDHFSMQLKVIKAYLVNNL